MEIFQAIILGIVEGITEFLPISSTGHLIVVSEWLSIDATEENKAFQVIIQLAAILAVVANYRDKFSLAHRALWLKVLIAFIPIALLGFLFHQQIKAMFTVPVVATMFILGGIAFLVVEYFYKEDPSHIEDMEAISYRQAFWVGIAQVFALIPGTSRAGASMIGGLLVGLSRKATAEFSFLLALPVLAAASLFDLVKHYKSFDTDDLSSLLAGFIAAFLVAYLTMKWFVRFIQTFTFASFGVYRILLGLLLLWIT